MKKTFQKQYGPWALITGANAGIGKALARQIAAKGVNIVAVARRQLLLDELADELKTDFGIEVRTIAKDLTEPGAVEDLENETRDLEIGLVVPNAGIEVSGSFFETDYLRDQQMLILNVVVPEQMARLFGSKLVARGHGGILLLSSLFGYQGVPLVAHYSATKAYILALGEALNVELSPQGVDVTVLSPGLTDTDMPAAMPIDFSKMPIIEMTPEKVARTGLRALGHQASIVPGLLNKIFVFENRFMPRSWPVKLFGFLLKRSWEKREAGGGAQVSQT